METAKLYKHIDEEDRLAIEALPRADRIAQLATLQGIATREKVIEIAELAKIPYLETIEMAENPAAVLPLRLINEYQCVPVKNSAQSGDAEGKEAPAEGEAPLSLVTLWPPDQRMNRWIYAACGRQPK